MLAELRQRMQAWMRPRAPETLPVVLDRHRIYVLPTGTGLFFALLLGTMLLGALNFNNNPALLLALLLAGATLASLIAAHLQLSGVRMDTVAAEPVLAGETITFSSVVESLRTSEKRPEWGIVQARNLGVNQRDEAVYSFLATAFVPRRATAGDASDSAKDARQRLSAALERAKATYDEVQAQGIESAKAAAKKADETIRAHPYESLGIAFGIGLLLGVLLRRK